MADYINIGLLFAEAAVAIVLTPELLRYRREYVDREARISLNLEIVRPHKAYINVFGFHHNILELSDFIDHLRTPKKYEKLEAGNELLIVGGPQSGKKALAFEIARQAGVDELIIIHNPRDADTLARAIRTIQKTPSAWKRAARMVTGHNAHANEKIMLLLPGLDHANGHSGEAWMDQLEGLIEMAATLPNVLIVGTAKSYCRDNEVASWFGAINQIPASGSEEWNTLMREVTLGYLTKGESDGFTLHEIKREDVVDRILKAAKDPSEVQDIINHCQSLAIFRQGKPSDGLEITDSILSAAIRRVIPPSPNTPKTQAEERLIS